MSVQYPVTLTPDDNGTLLVGFPDFPEAHTFGDTKEDALAHAVDALQTVIDAYIRDRQDIPEPSAVTAHSVTLPAMVATKVQLYRQMRKEHINKTQLAKRLNVHLPQVDRLLDVRHGSKLEQLEAAAKALGGHLEVTFVCATGVAHTNTKGLVRRYQAARRRVLQVHPGVLVQEKSKPPRRIVVGGKKR